MLRLIELLAIVSVAGIGFIGVQIVQGKGRAALISTIILGIFLVFYNSYLEENTGRGIAGHLYCRVFACHAVEAPGNESSGPQVNLAVPGQMSRPSQDVPNELVEDPLGVDVTKIESPPVDNGPPPVGNSSTNSREMGRRVLEMMHAETAKANGQPARR
jgi:hypothetical protein